VKLCFLPLVTKEMSEKRNDKKKKLLRMVVTIPLSFSVDYRVSGEVRAL